MITEYYIIDDSLQKKLNDMDTIGNLNRKEIEVLVVMVGQEMNSLWNTLNGDISARESQHFQKEYFSRLDIMTKLRNMLKALDDN